MMTYPQYMDYIRTADTPTAHAIRDNDIAALIRLCGGVVTVSAYTGIPYPTLQNWLYGTRRPPAYTTQLIGYALINAPR